MVLDPATYKGAYRLFLVFAPAPSDGTLTRQRRLLEGNEAGFAERDLVRGDLFESGMVTFDGKEVPPQEASAVLERFGVETRRFATVLVGKDGTVRRHFSEPVESEEPYATIDAMPMRRDMREKGHGGA